MGHGCYVCTTIGARIPARLNGPPGAANGGIAAGVLACPALRAAAADGVEHTAVSRITARIRQSVPVERELRFETTRAAEADDAAYDVTLLDGEKPLVTGTVAVVASERELRAGDALPGTAREAHPQGALLDEMARIGVPVDAPPFWELTGDHPIPNCFSCGPDNPDGLRIFPRSVADGVICAPWEASAEFDDGNGAISPMIVASALDCSSGICLPLSDQRQLLEEDRFFLLGTLDVRYLRLPPVDASYRVVARSLGREGRKFTGLSALFDADGALYATAEAIWVVAGVTRTQAFGAPRPA